MISLRLREDYFAIVSLGFSEIVRLVVTSEKWLTNGVQGIPGIPKLFAGFGVGIANGAQFSPCWCWSTWSPFSPCAGSSPRPSAG